MINLCIHVTVFQIKRLLSAPNSISANPCCQSVNTHHLQYIHVKIKAAHSHTQTNRTTTVYLLELLTEAQLQLTGTLIKQQKPALHNNVSHC